MYFYYPIVLAVFLLAGFLFGKLCARFGFSGIEGFFWFRGSTSLMAFLGLLFLILMVSLTHFFFPLAIFLVVFGFLKGISVKNLGFGENLEKVSEYEIVKVDDKNDSESKTFNGISPQSSAKKKQTDTPKIDWPDISEL
ncbi:MAG: hypothetical protein AB1403_23385 [Candidatus Riflebacteria bacterium]